MIRAKDETVWMRMKEKGNKAAGRTGPDDGIGGEWSKINVLMNSRSMVLRDNMEMWIPLRRVV